jgi:hypothetical protein
MHTKGCTVLRSQIRELSTVGPMVGSPQGAMRTRRLLIGPALQTRQGGVFRLALADRGGRARIHLPMRVVKAFSTTSGRSTDIACAARAGTKRTSGISRPDVARPRARHQPKSHHR